LAGVAALGILGFRKEDALPLILLIHGTQFVFICSMGIFLTWKEGLTLRSLSTTS